MDVQELMGCAPSVVSPETSIVEAARMMRDRGTRALAVCHKGALVGIVTAADIVARHVADGHELRLVGSLMTSSPQTVAPGEPAEGADALMDLHGIDHLPVCAEDRTIVGMLTRDDLRRRFLSPSSVSRPQTRLDPIDDLMRAALGYLHEVRQEIERLEPLAAAAAPHAPLGDLGVIGEALDGATGIAILVCDQDGVILAATRGAATLTGYPLDQLRGTQIEMLFAPAASAHRFHRTVECQLRRSDETTASICLRTFETQLGVIPITLEVIWTVDGNGAAGAS